MVNEIDDAEPKTVRYADKLKAKEIAYHFLDQSAGRDRAAKQIADALTEAREEYRSGWCCDYDFEEGTYRTSDCIGRTRNADVVEKASRERALREILEVVGHGDLDLVKGYLQAQLGMTKPFEEVRKRITDKRERQ